MPQLRLVKTLWGVPEAADPTKWKDLFARIKSENHEAVETTVRIFTRPGFSDALKEAGLKLVSCIQTTCVWDKSGNNDDSIFRYASKYSVADHLESIKEIGTLAKEHGAILINSHSGQDSWSAAQVKEYLLGVLEFEKELGIPICHETHRRRIFWNPFQTRDILSNDPDLADVKLNLDISHWVCCLERIFGHKVSNFTNGEEELEAWWPEVLKLLKKHVYLIHTRVGWEEGPQVADPAADEYSDQLDVHFNYYWKEVILAQIAQGRDTFVEPEHGPWPYQQSLPNTNTKPTVDIWQANKFIADKFIAAYPEYLKQAGVSQ